MRAVAVWKLYFMGHQATFPAAQCRAALPPGLSALCTTSTGHAWPHHTLLGGKDQWEQDGKGKLSSLQPGKGF